MKFSTKEDIEAPIDHVFRAVSDFDGFERSALRRGVRVQRKEALSHDSAEMGWEIGFDYRKKPRAVSAELIRYDPPNGLLFITMSPGVKGEGVVDLVALSRGRTRLSLTVELKPTSITGRLTIQSLKLAKSRLNQRLRIRVGQFADRTENSFRS